MTVEVSRATIWSQEDSETQEDARILFKRTEQTTHHLIHEDAIVFNVHENRA
jgi:hypothetical protein